jgi:hypothetical protein
MSRCVGMFFFQVLRTYVMVNVRPGLSRRDLSLGISPVVKISTHA